jgi:hypothetical protein
MAGRLNYQTASYQCIRPGELWQRNWLEGLPSPPHPVLFPVPCLFPVCALHFGVVNAERMKADRKQNWNNLPPSLRHSQQKNHKTPRIQSDWEYSKEAHGDKHNPEDFKRWRGLAEIGKQTDRIMLNEQTDIREVFKGKGNLEPIEEGWETV